MLAADATLPAPSPKQLVFELGDLVVHLSRQQIGVATSVGTPLDVDSLITQYVACHAHQGRLRVTPLKASHEVRDQKVEEAPECLRAFSVRHLGLAGSAPGLQPWRSLLVLSSDIGVSCSRPAGVTGCLLLSL